MNTPAHITEKKLFENGRVFIAPTKARDVVTVVGSVLGGPNMLARAKLGVPMLAGGLFDAGTKKTSKEKLRESLASRGATLSFYSSGDRTGFSGSCLPEDVPFLLDIIVECLGQAMFPEKEISVERAQLLGRLKESKTDTRTQAARELSRLLFDEKHVNYSEKDAFVEKAITNAKRKQLLDFRSELGKGGLVLAIVGDTNVSSTLKAVEKSFGKLKTGTGTPPKKSQNKKLADAQEKRIEIPEKANVDVFFGAAIPLTIDDTLYLPFMTVTDMLGGGFASHLMQTVRERDGLTYGIYSAPAGFAKDVQGAFRILATFSPELFDKGVETIRREMKHFFGSGLTKGALAKKKDELTGSYVIGLSTTGGLANILHKIGVEGKQLSYIDDYPDLVRVVSLEQVNDAAKLIPLSKLAVVAAGTFKR